MTFSAVASAMPRFSNSNAARRNRPAAMADGLAKVQDGLDVLRRTDESARRLDEPQPAADELSHPPGPALPRNRPNPDCRREGPPAGAPGREHHARAEHH